MRGDSWKVGKNSQRFYELFDSSSDAQPLKDKRLLPYCQDHDQN